MNENIDIGQALKEARENTSKRNNNISIAIHNKILFKRDLARNETIFASYNHTYNNQHCNILSRIDYRTL